MSGVHCVLVIARFFYFQYVTVCRQSSTRRMSVVTLLVSGSTASVHAEKRFNKGDTIAAIKVRQLAICGEKREQRRGYLS